MSEQEQDEDFPFDPSDIVQVLDLDDDDVKEEPLGEKGDEEYYGDEEYDLDEEGDNDDAMDTGEASARFVPEKDDSIKTFDSHLENAVICSQFSPVNNQLVITGGQDDQAFVWDVTDGSVLFKCTGHTDTVASVGFSHDGSMVATSDLAGLIKVWKTDSGSEIWSFEVSEIEWLEWHPAAPVLLVGTKEGQVWMWKVPQGDCKTFTGFGSTALCGHFLPDGKRAYVGYDDGALKVWDLKSTEAVFTISGHEGHKGPVFCVDHKADGSLIASGSGDMTVKVVSTVTGKVVATLECSKSNEEEDSVEAVGFCKSHDFLAIGTLSGNLEIWDLPSKTLRYKCQHPYGIVKLKWSPADPFIYTISLDGNVRCYDGRNGDLLKMWQGHCAGILDFDIASDVSSLVTASDDFTAKVFSLR